MQASRATLILFITIFIAMLGLSVLFPVLAPLSKDLGLSTAQTTWFSTIYSLAQFISAPFWGNLSETKGRKPILILGLLGFSLTFGLFGYLAHLGVQGTLSGSALFWLLLASRALGGLLSSATLPTAQAYLADITPPEKRSTMMGIIGAAFGLGIIFGPAIGGGLSQYGLLTPVYFSAALGVCTAIMAAITLPESLHLRSPESKPQEKALFTRGDIPVLLAISMFTTLASVGMEQTISFYIQDNLKLSGVEAVRTIALSLTVFGIVAVMVQGGFMRPLSKKFSQVILIRSGLAVMAVGMLILPFTHTLLTITAALCILGIGSALIGPSLSAALSLKVANTQQGSIAGLNSSAGALGRMLGPVLAGYMYQHVSQGSPYFFSGVVLLLLLGVAYFLLDTAKPRAES